MGIILIVFAIIVFLLGFVTPLNDLYTFPLSLLIFALGLILISKNKKMMNRRVSK